MHSPYSPLNTCPGESVYLVTSMCQDTGTGQGLGPEVWVTNLCSQMALWPSRVSHVEASELLQVLE